MRKAILHQGSSRVVFGSFPETLSRITGLPIVDTEEGLDWAYLLAWDAETPPRCRTFIPWDGIQFAHDKRTQARAFTERGIAIPETHLLPDAASVRRFVADRPDKDWTLKWPLGCGGTGHQILTSDTPITRAWPAPHLVQEFLRLESPSVHRLYVIAGEPLGWIIRRYPDGVTPSPWVALARGAIAEWAGDPPAEVVRLALGALRAGGLDQSFGCVDLLRHPDGHWVVLEVNTDGIYEYVARDLGLPDVTAELHNRLAAAVARA